MPQTWPIDLIQKAWHLAAELHQGQTYSGPEKDQEFEYLKHIGSVTLEILHALQHDTNLDPNIAIPCAILHDTIEDTPATYAQIKDTFGQAVADGVQALSKDDRLPDKPSQMADSLDRIRQQPKSVWAVKLADRIVNLDPPPYHWSKEKIAAYRQEARTILDTLEESSPFLANRLREKISRYEDFLI